MRVASALMAALLGLGVVVQLNDPDPLLWMAVYALAAGVSAAAALGRAPARLTAAVALALTALALWWTPELRHARPQSFDSFGMHSERDERVREAAGLWVCALWTGLLAWRQRTPR